METKYVRHGDVLLSPVESLPEGTTIAHKGEHVLAWGEITGHAHRLRVKNQDNLKVIQAADGLYLCLMEVGTLTHEEHAKVEIPAGTYKMNFEREFDYAMEDMRQVVD